MFLLSSEQITPRLLLLLIQEKVKNTSRTGAFRSNNPTLTSDTFRTQHDSLISHPEDMKLTTCEARLCAGASPGPLHLLVSGLSWGQKWTDVAPHALTCQDYHNKHTETHRQLEDHFLSHSHTVTGHMINNISDWSSVLIVTMRSAAG